MISLIFIVAFVVCFAIAVTCVVIGHEMTNNYKGAFFRLYLYYLVAFYVFAIYAIWGQIAMQTLLSAVQTTRETEELVGMFMPILGVPFLIISMIMFIKMGYALVKVSTKNNAFYPHLVMLLLIPIFFGGLYLGYEEAVFSMKPGPLYLVVLILCIEIIYMIFFMAIVIRHLKNVVGKNQRIIRQLTLLLFAGLLFRAVSLAFYSVAIWALAPLILVYFLSHLMALWYLRQQSNNLFEPISAERPNAIKKTQLYQKYHVTPREQEVIEQLCLGKTNQQIADTLFISLQTVKDHTHRIYNKVGINSRMKLVRMIND